MNDIYLIKNHDNTSKGDTSVMPFIKTIAESTRSTPCELWVCVSNVLEE